MSMILFPTLAAGGTNPTMSFTANAADSSNTDVYTFSAMSLGAAAANRKIIVAAYGSGGTDRTVSNVTIGGVSDTEIATTISSSGAIRTYLGIADVPTGTTGDVVVTFSGSYSRAGAAVWRVVDLDSSTAHQTGTDADDANGDLAVSLDVPAGGFAIAAACFNDTGAIACGGLTEQFEMELEGGAGDAVGSSDSFVSAQTALSITCNSDQNDSRNSMVAASWGN
jgi:hypothetical protein